MQCSRFYVDTDRLRDNNPMLLQSRNLCTLHTYALTQFLLCQILLQTSPLYSV